MTRRKPLFASSLSAFVVIACALLLGGCGGKSKPKELSKSDYVSQLKSVASELSSDIQAATVAATPTARAAAITKAQSDLRKGEKQLDAMAPPAPVKALHAKLAAAFGELADELDPLIAKAKAGDATAVSGVPSLKGFKDIEADSSAIAAAGYNVIG